MANRMQKNYEAVTHPLGSLKESVDSIRTSIRDLYELDEDNYQMIRNLQKALDKSNNRYNDLSRRYVALRKLVGFGIIFLGVGGVMIAKAIDNHEERITNIELKSKVPEDNQEKDEEKESDG